MINLYSGTPGSGKSLHTAETIFYALIFGRPCICNFDINSSSIKKVKGEFHYIDNESLTPNYLINFSLNYFSNHKFKEETILLCIDESQLLFNCREWDAAGRKEWMSFFTQHRKYGYNIILIAQFDRMLDRQIRSLIEYEYKHRKVSNFGIYGKLLSLFCMGHLHVAVKIWYPLSEKVGSEFFVAKKKYYQLYDSYSTFGSGNLLSQT